MKARIDVEILNIDSVICKNIAAFESSKRGFLLQNILSQLRNFVEHISLKIYGNGQDIENTYENIVNANKYISSKGDLNFINKFHKLLRNSVSHYTPDEENSERLMLKYCEYLFKIKAFLKKEYNIDVLENIDKFTINTDSTLREYYEKIATKINKPKWFGSKNVDNERYYITKIKPFYVKHNVYYEVTFTMANDRSSKYNRIIAFTKLDIPHNYAIKFSIKNDNINILGKYMPIQIIDNWEISIRPSEFKNFAKIFSKNLEIKSNSTEYRELMKFLSETSLNLVELIDFADDNYSNTKKRITQNAKNIPIFDILDKCRELTENNYPGSRVIRYLLYKLSNKIIKQQYESDSCIKLSNLNLKYGCIPFDEMPYCSSLNDHNPKFLDLFDCIDPKSREHELFAKFIKNNTEKKRQLYTPKKDIENFNNIDDLIQIYNNSLYLPKHENRRLENYKNTIYIRGYEEDTCYIIMRLKELSSIGIINYAHSVNVWLQSFTHSIDSDEKKIFLQQMFEHSKVALIYGSAGTGKSTMINHLSHFFNDKKKLYLAKTNPAVDNLRRKVDSNNCDFKTIDKFLRNKDCYRKFDLLIVDECSTVSNSDMYKVLQKASFELLVLVGDDFQIESITFGNWFGIARSFIPKTAIFELTKPYRSKNSNLLSLWNKVRNVEDDILEHMTKNKYSARLDESIFEHFEEDEIILCLNYDGLYGINNINSFLQSNNRNISVKLGVQAYKINDPILFNESERFAPLIYNNSKGKIVGIKKFEDKIQFDIELDKVINQLDAKGYSFELMANSDSSNSVIRFSVDKYRSTDDDDDDSSNTVIPFQIAYAVSIHKAQGLEYNSVKIVITDEIEEMITHNIFYTAITRAKKKLKIYWTPEVGNKILSKLERKTNEKDVALLSKKINSNFLES
jgi:energy-coupling factor transporter ATP-binding protein EcfA2